MRYSDEHYNRSPDCPFFVLLEATQGAKRVKAKRVSKASRLSVQSVATITSEASLMSESIVNPEDSVLTTTSTAGAKKGKARKAAATKTKKTKTKKEEIVEEADIAEEEAPAPKLSRGKKRDSAAMDDSAMTASKAPASKKRATRKRATDMENSNLAHDDTEMSEAPATKKAGRKKTQKTAKSTRAASAVSVASTQSATSVPGAFPDDDEIERQLEADLARPLSDDEDVTLDSGSERLKASKNKERASTSHMEAAEQSTNYAMFNPAPVDLDEEVEDELKALQAEMEVEEPQPEEQPELEPQALQVPKKGRKAGTRKPSKQTKTKKSKAHTPEPVEEPEEEVEVPEPQPDVEDPPHEDSLASTGTVIVKKMDGVRESTGKRGRGRPSKASLASRESMGAVKLIEAPEEALDSQTESPAEEGSFVEAAEPPARRGRGRPSKASLASRASVDVEPSQVAAAAAAPKRGRGRPSKKSLEARQSIEAASSQEALEVIGESVERLSLEATEATKLPVVSFAKPSQSPVGRNGSPAPPSGEHLGNAPSTPGRVISPAPSARQAALSPSQSPQSSDAENQPPSSKPATTTKRIALAPVVATPVHISPSKRNMIAGLRSTTPWTELDVDAILGSPRSNSEKENTKDQFLKQGKALTSPEKAMTVEEWINYNASEAEKKLKDECEAMVSRFESEGTKAMSVLEGLVVE